jgi:hypothetical protein
VKHERPLDIVGLPPDDALIFRFGESMIADKAVVWFEGSTLVWLRRGVRRELSLFLVLGVEAYCATVLGRPVRHINLKPLGFVEATGGYLPAQLTFQDHAGPLLAQREADFLPFAAELGAKLKTYRPFLRIEGDSSMLNHAA